MSIPFIKLPCSIPRSWHEMEYQCRSSGGHLVSFDTQVSLISKGIKRNEDFLCPRNLISRFVYDEVWMLNICFDLFVYISISSQLININFIGPIKNLIKFGKNIWNKPNQNKYRTRATITCSWSVTALVYKPRILKVR